MNKTIIAAAIALVLVSGAKQVTAQQAVQPMSVEWCTERGMSGTDECPTRPKPTAQEQKEYDDKVNANYRLERAADAAYYKAHPEEAKLTAEVVQCHKDFQDPRGAKPGTPAYIEYASVCNQAEQDLKDRQFPVAAHAVKAKPATVAAPAQSDHKMIIVPGSSLDTPENRKLAASINESLYELRHPGLVQDAQVSKTDRPYDIPICNQLSDMLVKIANDPFGDNVKMRQAETITGNMEQMRCDLHRR